MTLDRSRLISNFLKSKQYLPSIIKNKKKSQIKMDKPSKSSESRKKADKAYQEKERLAKELKKHNDKIQKDNEKKRKELDDLKKQQNSRK